MAADHAPISLDDIKADLGITDASQDDWLQRRIDGAWSRMELYTRRKLCSPPQPFVDDWGEIAFIEASQPMPPPLWYPPSATVFLRYFPVASIDALELDGTAGTPADVRFDPRNGKLFTLVAGSIYAEDLSRVLIGQRARITYKAGWDTLPADLYEIVMNAVQVQWRQRAAQVAGMTGPGGGTITQIDAADVGSVQMSDGNMFQQSSARSSGGDPLLGPYLGMLDAYIDHRSGIWAGQPTTRPVVEAAP